MLCIRGVSGERERRGGGVKGSDEGCLHVFVLPLRFEDHTGGCVCVCEGVCGWCVCVVGVCGCVSVCGCCGVVVLWVCVCVCVNVCVCVRVNVCVCLLSG